MIRQFNKEAFEPGPVRIIRLNRSGRILRSELTGSALAGRCLPDSEVTSLGVALRAEPRNPAVSVHPLVDLGLAGEAGDLARLAARVVRLNRPVVVGDPDGFKRHFCFCHALYVSNRMEIESADVRRVAHYLPREIFRRTSRNTRRGPKAALLFQIIGQAAIGACFDFQLVRIFPGAGARRAMDAPSIFL